MRNVQLLVVCLLSICFRLALAQAGAPADSAARWQRLALGDGASVLLPGRAKLSPTSAPGVPAYVLNRHEVIYAVVVNHPDSTEAAQPDGSLDEKERDMVYEAMLQSFIGKNPSARVVRRGSFAVAGRRGVEAQLDVPDTPNLARAKFVRILYINRTIYLLTWRATAAHPATDEPDSRRRFFASLQVKASPQHRPVGAYALGRLVGRLLGRLAVLAAVAAGIILFILWQSRPARRS